MRISDWSSDVCSSDLGLAGTQAAARPEGAEVLVAEDRGVARARLPEVRAEGPGDQAAARHQAALRADQGSQPLHHDGGRPAPDVGGAVLQVRAAEPLDDVRRRSEEHTSELQSLMRISYAVFCLKKKKQITTQN